MEGKILIVDDKPEMLLLLERIITESTDYEVVPEVDPVNALERLRKTSFDLVLTDLRMPKLDGIGLLDKIKEIDSQVGVVIMTAYGTIETAVEATQKGAYDYITKPFRRERILLTIDKAMNYRRVVHENRILWEALAGHEGFADLIGSTAVMKEIFNRVRQVAPTSATVLITGPSRYRQGTAGPSGSPVQRAKRPQNDNRELYRHSGKCSGERTVRPCQRRFHRRVER